MKPNLARAFLTSTLWVVSLCGWHVALAAPASDACSLLTTAQVSEALGISVQSVEHVAPNSPKMCGWSGPAGPANAKRVVASIIIADMFNHEKSPMTGIVETQAPGVGDEAHYMTTPGFGTGLSVKKGSVAFKIRVFGFSDDVVKQKEKDLAQKALAKL